MGSAQAPPTPDSLTATQLARRGRIVDAAIELLGESDYEHIQMRDVADRAGVALGTIYRYFASKEHLFGTALVVWAATLRTQIRRHPLRGETNSERLGDVLRRAVRAFQRQPQFYRVMMMLQATSDPLAADCYRQLSGATTATFRQAVDGLPEDLALGLVRVSEAVLDANLREWALGRSEIASVYEALDDAVHLLLEFCELSEPRQARRSVDSNPAGRSARVGG
ncbi:MAG TPA: TetR family transcriptional regulator [Acidimicrobiales bacterium]|nr:TetR family transcriptional regulator [Acidimicrobiales bacterium]